MAGGRTGSVFLRDYDVGLARTLGAELIEIELDGEMVQTYGLRLEGVTGPELTHGLIPVQMSDPEDAYTAHLLPQIVVSRGSVTPSMANRWNPGGREYLTRSAAAKTVVADDGRTGPSQVEIKRYALPFDISYDVHLRARLRAQADRMLQHVGRIFWAYGQIFLIDSEGDQRGYYAFVDSYENLSEIADVADRLQGHTVSLRVEAELDFEEPFVAPTQYKMRGSVGVGGGTGPGSGAGLGFCGVPKPEGGGLPGVGPNPGGTALGSGASGTPDAKGCFPILVKKE
jgi:hypothetical protein